jgi:hypothetical protein
MLHRLCGPPSIPLSFNLAVVLPRWITYRFRLNTQHKCRTSSYHRLQRGLPGYLILFAPHAFVPQRQSLYSNMPPQSVFYVISMNFTSTLRIPATSKEFKSISINRLTTVKLLPLTTDLINRLRTL